MNTLIISTCESHRQEYCAWLQSAGHIPAQVATGEQGIAACNQQQVHLIVSELDSASLELCRHIRAHQSAVYTYILLVVDEGMSHPLAAEAIQCGADAIIGPHPSPTTLQAHLGVAARIQALQSQTQLEPFICMCVYCRSIRATQDEWQPVDKYLHEHAHTMVSHGICPACLAVEKRKLKDMQSSLSSYSARRGM